MSQATNMALDLDRLPVENGFRMRGESMTRVETFISAAFAFALTLLVISFDSIPQNHEELIDAAKGIPAFTVSFAQIMSFWFAHAKWSRRFGLQDFQTVVLGFLLILIVLIYIYPLRLMFTGLFAWLTNGWLPSSMEFSLFSLRYLFIFYAIGFCALSAVLALMQLHALRKQELLELNALELYDTKTELQNWLILLVIPFIGALLAWQIANKYLLYSPFIYISFAFILPLHSTWRARHRPSGEG